VIVSLDPGFESIPLWEFQDGMDSLNCLPVQIQQSVVTALAFIHPDQRIGPVEIANELFQGLVVAGRSKCTTCGRNNRVQSVPLLRGENGST
jgi:hypothetical protein